MFFVIRDIRRSWVLFVAAGLAALYTFLKKDITDWPTYLDDGISLFVTASSGVLAFVLSFQLSLALSKNAGGIAAFNGICGDLLAMAMHVVALSSDDPQIKDSQKFVAAKRNLRDLLLAAPGMFKWNMRPAGINIDLVQVKQDGDQSVKLYERNEKMYCLIKRYMSIGGVEALMLAIGNELHTIRESGALDGAQETVLMAKWEHIYANYGAITGVASPPKLIDWFLYVTLAIYIIFMPYEFAGMEYHGVYLAFFTAYFYLGLWIATQRVGDPFAEGIDASEFDTVTAPAKAIQDAIEEMFKRESALSLDDNACESTAEAVLTIAKDAGLRKNITQEQLRNEVEMNSSSVNYVSTVPDKQLQKNSKKLHW